MVKLHYDIISESPLKELEDNLKMCFKNWKKHSDVVVVCIGSDRATGDSLGPLVGQLLENKAKFLKVYGTLDNTVNALTLEDTLEEINQSYKNPLIIAIDACLGKADDIGKIIVSDSPLKPGAAVRKDLPYVGNYSIKGIVNIAGFMEQSVLQSTRLGLVYKMSHAISQALINTDKRLHSNNLRIQKRKQKAVA